MPVWVAYSMWGASCMNRRSNLTQRQEYSNLMDLDNFRRNDQNFYAIPYIFPLRIYRPPHKTFTFAIWKPPSLFLPLAIPQTNTSTTISFPHPGLNIISFHALSTSILNTVSSSLAFDTHSTGNACPRIITIMSSIFRDAKS